MNLAFTTVHIRSSSSDERGVALTDTLDDEAGIVSIDIRSASGDKKGVSSIDSLGGNEAGVVQLMSGLPPG
jgi:hypothetical protein